MLKKTHFSIGKRNLQCKNHWEVLDINNFKIEKPTVLCFGGNGTLINKDANVICRCVQNLIGLKEKSNYNELATSEDVDIVGFAYGVSHHKRDRESSISCLTENETLEIVDKMFVPLFSKENKKILDNENILKNFNKITFFSHCHGATEVSLIINCLKEKMQDMGVKEDLIEESLGQMFHVSYSPMRISDIPTLQILTENDDVNALGPITITKEHFSTQEFLYQIFSGNIDWFYHNGLYKDGNKTATLITSNMTNSIGSKNGDLNFRDEHPLDFLDRDQNWNVEDYISIYGDKVSQVASYALSNSVANSIQNMQNEKLIPKPTINDVVDEGRDILEKTQRLKFYNFIKDIKVENEEDSNDLDNIINEMQNPPEL